MVARRMVGFFVLLLVVIVAIAAIWYIGGQKSVYDLMLSFQW